MKKTISLSVFIFSLALSFNTAAQCFATTQAGLQNCMDTNPGNIQLNASFSLSSSLTMSNNTDYSITTNGFNVTWTPSVTAFTGGNGNVTLLIATSSGTTEYRNNGSTPNIGTTLQNQGGFSSILPIELASFEVKNFQKSNAIFWQTSSEQNNEKFIVEKSSDGTRFSPIGEVQGAGTSFQQNKYVFTDATPFSGLNYYRLRQMDFDGASSLSPVRSILVSSENSTSVYPTITRNEFYLETKADEIFEVYLFDTQGRMIQSFENIQSQSTSIELSALPKGSYFVFVKTSEGVSHHRVMHN